MKYTVSEIMMALIRCEVCGGKFPTRVIDALGGQELKELYELSKKHDLEAD